MHTAQFSNASCTRRDRIILIGVFKYDNNDDIRVSSYNEMHFSQTKLQFRFIIWMNDSAYHRKIKVLWSENINLPKLDCMRFTKHIYRLLAFLGAMFMRMCDNNVFTERKTFAKYGMDAKHEPEPSENLKRLLRCSVRKTNCYIILGSISLVWADLYVGNGLFCMKNSRKISKPINILWKSSLFVRKPAC